MKYPYKNDSFCNMHEKCKDAISFEEKKKSLKG